MHLMIFTSQSQHLIEENDLMRKHSHFLVSVKLTILFFFFFFNKVGMHGALSFNGIILTNLNYITVRIKTKDFLSISIILDLYIQMNTSPCQYIHRLVFVKMMLPLIFPKRIQNYVRFITIP